MSKEYKAQLLAMKYTNMIGTVVRVGVHILYFLRFRNNRSSYNFYFIYDVDKALRKRRRLTNHYYTNYVGRRSEARLHGKEQPETGK